MSQHFVMAWGLLLCAAGAQAQAPAPAKPTLHWPTYTLPTQVKADCDRVIADTRDSQPRITGAEASALLREIDALTQRQQAVAGPLTLLAAVHPQKPIRDAVEACEQRLQALNTAWAQSPALYAALRRVQPADAIDQRLLQDRLDAMADAGVALPAAQRQRMRKLDARLLALTQDFERRVREDRTQLSFSAAELADVPESVWATAPRNAQGLVVLRPDSPTYDALTQYASNPRTRERMWRAGQNLGGTANLRTLAQLADARRERAQLLGHASYADGLLRRRMAGSEAAVQSFLAEVQQHITEREQTDMLALREAKAAELGQPLAQTRLQHWDVPYYVGLVRQQRYALDLVPFRASMPPRAALGLSFGVAERLFGVKFEPVALSLWHNEARAYAVVDADTGITLGHLLTDLHPREGKYGHAAVWGVQAGSTLTGRLPVAALVANLDRQGLALAELVTLLHEFGHAMHHLLSRTRYAAHGGLDSLLDFVEAPSQMFEDWAYDPQVQPLLRAGCPECTPVSAEWLASAERARHFAKGLGLARQHLYARYDLALYGRTPVDPLKLWAQMCAATPMGHVQGTHFPSNFEHVAGFYAAGYYGYLWSQVAADDLHTAFAADRLDAAVGKRYRDEVLARGAEEHPTALMRRFLGREPSRDAFFKSLNQH